jgi:hypothetical protein
VDQIAATTNTACQEDKLVQEWWDARQEAFWGWMRVQYVKEYKYDWCVLAPLTMRTR